MNGFVSSEVELIRVVGNGSFITILGGIASGSDTAIYIAAGDPGTTTISVAATGFITGVIAINLFATNAVVVNAGLIDSLQETIRLGGSDFGAMEIDNTGTIMSANNHAIARTLTSVTFVRLDNSGTIRGADGSDSYHALDVTNATDHVTNSGVMIGSVRLGGGADRYDGRGGGFVDGEIMGESGEDLFLPGVQAETFIGGADSDVVSFSGSPGVVLALDFSRENTGWAKGDFYSEIEIFFGTRSADSMYGNAAANTFWGGAGNDQLIGNNGNDRLNGEEGNDRIYGGANSDWIAGGIGVDSVFGGTGNDIFLFRSATEGRDIVGDFSSAAAGNNDTIQVLAAGFGGGLVAGALNPLRFVVRGDNLAQDIDDRFIFRTTDNTLWFDRDGTGGSAPVMLADLQPTATMSSLDIVLV